LANSSMTVVHLNRDQNSIEVGAERYMVVFDSQGGAHTIAGKCSHRGGPLHLGAMDPSGRFIVCPWHKNRTSLANAVAKELPTVSVGDRISIVLGPGTQSDAHPLRRTFLLDCKTSLIAGSCGATKVPK
jgi:nitrite reductase/ring-hydroxylating ferredoxin subunit